MSSPKSLVSKFMLVSFAASLAGLASAAPLTYFGFDATPGGTVPAGGGSQAARTLFTSTLSSNATESFEGAAFVAGTQPTSARPQAVFGGNGTMFQNDGAPGTTRIENNSFVGNSFTGRFNTSSATPGKWWETSASFTLSLTSTVQAFGFYGTDFGDFRGSLTIDLFNGNAAVGSTVVPGGAAGNRSLLFFGFADSAINFNRIVFNLGQVPTAPGQFDFAGFDDLIIGTLNGTTPPPTGVPEPGTLALAALSLGLLAAARRRRG